MRETPYGPDLASIHHIGFSGYSDLCGPGVIEQLDAVLQKGSTVLELGCGSGGLTRQLIDPGYTVIATDASPDMLDIAREEVPGADVRRLTLPDDPFPSADAVVSVGHTLNYLESAETIGRTLVEAARALRPGGVSFSISVISSTGRPEPSQRQPASLKTPGRSSRGLRCRLPTGLCAR